MWPVFAAERAVEISAAYSIMSFVKTFPDPLYLNESDYVSSVTQQGRVRTRFENFFKSPFELAYQGLSIKSASRSAQGNLFYSEGYYSSFMHAASSIDTGIFRWHFGLAALLTLSTRSYSKAGGVEKEPAIDTALSQVYPTGGFTLFPKAPVRFSMIFLNGDANLLYGWLRLQAEFEIGSHTLSPAVEILNHASFGKGVPDLVTIPSAFSVGYAIRFSSWQIFSRAGFVLNATGGFRGTPVSLSERLIFEVGVNYSLL